MLGQSAPLLELFQDLFMAVRGLRAVFWLGPPFRKYSLTVNKLVMPCAPPGHCKWLDSNFWKPSNGEMGKTALSQTYHSPNCMSWQKAVGISQ